MNRIINGKRYNTETAQRIGAAQHPVGGYEETLYRKRSGGYFYHLTDGKSDGILIPANLANATKWARERLTPEEFDAAFGPDASPSALFVQIGPELMAAIRRGAEAEGQTVKAFVERILRDALDDPNQK